MGSEISLNHPKNRILSYFLGFPHPEVTLSPRVTDFLREHPLIFSFIIHFSNHPKIINNQSLQSK